MILHLVTKADWDAGPVDRPYVPGAYASDGFIHCTQGDDLMLQVANRFYKGVPGEFFVLGIDEQKVKAQIKWEPPAAPATAVAQPPVEVPPEVTSEYGSNPQAVAVPEPPAAEPKFPHIYGPLNRDAIVEIRRLVRAADGAFIGYEPAAAAPATTVAPAGVNLKSASQLANELVDATGDFSDALARYKDRVEARMDEIDKNIKDHLG